MTQLISCLINYILYGFYAEFLGRTEVAVSKILEESRNLKTPLLKRLPLHEVESGEITVKVHLQIFEK